MRKASVNEVITNNIRANLATQWVENFQFIAKTVNYTENNFWSDQKCKRGRRIESICEEAQQKSNTEKQQNLRDCSNGKEAQTLSYSGNGYQIFSF